MNWLLLLEEKYFSKLNSHTLLLPPPSSASPARFPGIEPLMMPEGVKNLLTDSLLINCISTYNPWPGGWRYRRCLTCTLLVHGGSYWDSQQPPCGQRPGETLVLTIHPLLHRLRRASTVALDKAWSEDLCNSDGLRLNLQEGQIRHNEVNFVRKIQSL